MICKRIFFIFVIIETFCVLAIHSKNNRFSKRSATSNWSDWIILPGHPTIRYSDPLDASRRMNYFPYNKSYSLSSYLQPVDINQEKTEPYVLAISKRNDEGKIQSKNISKDPTEITVSMRGITEKIKNVIDIAKQIFSDDETSDGSESEENSVEKMGFPVTSRKKSGIKKFKKKYKKIILPLLIAYKLKFLTLVPVLIGGLVLLVGTTGMAGFFFALFAAIMSLKPEHGQVIVKRYR